MLNLPMYIKSYKTGSTIHYYYTRIINTVKYGVYIYVVQGYIGTL